MEELSSGDFFINTIKRQKKRECPSSAVIAGTNGHVGFRLARALQEKGCEVALFAKDPSAFMTEERFFAGRIEDIFTEEYADVFRKDAVLYVPMYSLEPLDTPLSDTKFILELQKRAVAAGFSRIVLVTSIVHSDRPEVAEQLGRLRKVLGGNEELPVSHFKVSLIVGGETALAQELAKTKPPVFILPKRAQSKECTPIHTDDLIEYLRNAHDAELPRDYMFEIGGLHTLSFKDAAEYLLRRTGNPARVVTGVGIRELFSRFAFRRALASSDVLQAFVEQSQYSMVADTDELRSYYPEIAPKSITHY